MTKSKALDRILADLGLPRSCEDYVLQTMGRLGCDDDIDMETVKSLEVVIRKEMQ